MSARQNKKRKGRTVTVRERTVTTLTKDPNTPYLVPTPTEDPPSANIMSSPFSVASSSGANQHQPSMSPTTFPFTGNYGFTYNNYMSTLHPSVHPQQAQSFFHPSPPHSALPPGQSDLEILENLKKAIKDGQHDFYQAIPQPEILASMYLGPTHVPPHPEQISDQHSLAYPKALAYDRDGSQSELPENSASISLSSSLNSGLVIPPLIFKEELVILSDNTQSKDVGAQHKPISAPPAPTSTTLPSTTSSQTTHIQAPTRRFSGGGVGPASAMPQSRSDSRRQTLDTKSIPGPGGRASSDIPSPQTSTKFGSGTDSPKPMGERSTPNQSSQGSIHASSSSSVVSPSVQDTTVPAPQLDNKKDPSGPAGQNRQPPPHRAVQPPARDSNPLTSRANYPDTSASTNDTPARLPSSRDSKHVDRDKERDSERDGDWDTRGSDRNRPIDHGIRDDRPGTDFQRTPSEPRHVQTGYISYRSVDWRPDHGADRDRDGTTTVAADGSLPVSDRISDDQSARGPITGDRHTRPAPTQDRQVSGDRSSRPAVTALTRAEVVIQRPIGTEPPVGPALENKRSQSVVSVDERGSRPPRSLQDRLSQPPQSTGPQSEHATRKPGLEERLSDANHATTTLTPPSDNRPAHTKKVQGVTGPEQARTGDDRSQIPEPGQVLPSTRERTPRPEEHPTHPRAIDRERYARPALVSRHGNAVPRPGSAHYEERPLPRKTSMSRPPARPFRPGPDAVRDRPDMRNGHVPGGYPDGRRPDDMDIDAPPRFNDSRTLYNRPISPDPARDRPRVPYSHLPPSSREALAYDVELDRRYTLPGERREWGYPQQPPPGPYSDRQREWAPVRDEEYWKSQPRRFERDAPPSPDRGIGWDERERKPPFANNSPSMRSPFDAAPHRSLGSRLTDEYPGTGSGSSTTLDDRGFPRDMDRQRYLTPGSTPPPSVHHSRVRMRSPSPVERRMGDDMRPPMKRAREEVPYAHVYHYSPPSREPPRRPSFASEYSQRVPTPPPSSGGSYYDPMARPPPPPPATAPSSGGPDPPYMGPRFVYDRRSPPPPPPPGRFSGPPPSAYARGGYGRGDPRDDRRMNMAPPPPRTA